MLCTMILSEVIPASFVKTNSGRATKACVPGDCFLDLAWPSPNLLLRCTVSSHLIILALFRSITLFLPFCLSVSDCDCLSLSFLLCACPSSSEAESEQRRSEAGLYDYSSRERQTAFSTHLLTHSTHGQFVYLWLNSSTPSPSCTHTHTLFSLESFHQRSLSASHTQKLPSNLSIYFTSMSLIKAEVVDLC